MSKLLTKNNTAVIGLPEAAKSLVEGVFEGDRLRLAHSLAVGDLLFDMYSKRDPVEANIAKTVGTLHDVGYGFSTDVPYVEGAWYLWNTVIDGYDMGEFCSDVAHHSDSKWWARAEGISLDNFEEPEDKLLHSALWVANFSINRYGAFEGVERGYASRVEDIDINENRLSGLLEARGSFDSALSLVKRTLVYNG